MKHLRKFNESNDSESDLLIITDVFQEFTDEYDVEAKITNMSSVNRFMVIIDTQKMEIKGDKKKVISHLIDLKNKCIEMSNLSMIEMSISFVRIPYYPPSPHKILDYKKLEISDIKDLEEFLLPINWVRIIFEKND
jgi:hypothetical protein